LAVPAVLLSSPMPSEIAEQVRLAETEAAEYEARLLARPFSYNVGDQVEFAGERFEIEALQKTLVAGYWLRRVSMKAIFISLDYESELVPTLN
jgi:hypothetical protein